MGFLIITFELWLRIKILVSPDSFGQAKSNAVFSCIFLKHLKHFSQHYKFSAKKS